MVQVSPSVRPASAPIPRLENGDRLTRDEFERRYAQMPNVTAELIEGVVYMAAALRYRHHGKPHGDVMGWLGLYAAYTPGVELADNTTVRLDTDNEPQPDALLRFEESYRGQSSVSEDDYIEGAPELIVEIAASTVSYDLHDKLNAYRRNGVQEYLIWLIDDHEFRWYVLEQGKYILQEPDDQNLVHSRIFPGLSLAVDALLAGNMAEVLDVQQSALKSNLYQMFVKNLAKRCTS